jgi:predicted  nucleic acid-binding Zn-ribbon protein
MKREEVISALEALTKESKVANAQIEYSYELDRIKRRLTELEDEVKRLREENKGS